DAGRPVVQLEVEVHGVVRGPRRLELRVPQPLQGGRGQARAGGGGQQVAAVGERGREQLRLRGAAQLQRDLVGARQGAAPVAAAQLLLAAGEGGLGLRG